MHVVYKFAVSVISKSKWRWHNKKSQQTKKADRVEERRISSHEQKVICNSEKAQQLINQKQIVCLFKPHTKDPDKNLTFKLLTVTKILGQNFFNRAWHFSVMSLDSFQMNSGRLFKHLKKTFIGDYSFFQLFMIILS